jgi:hypothetical protein
MIAGELEIRLMADIARIRRDMDDARRVVGGAMGDISRVVDVAKKAFIAFAGAASVGAFAGMIKGSIDAAGGMHDLSIQTGASVASLMAFRAVAVTSDTTIQGIGAAMNKLAKQMAVANEESKGTGQAIQAIGLDFAALKSMAPDQQMLTIAKALDHFQDGAGKSAVAMTLFGKEGAKMLPFLKDLADEADSVTASLTDQQVKAKAAQAAMADDFGDNLAKIKKASDQWKKDLAMGMLPALYEASDAFLKVTTGASSFKDGIAKLSADGTFASWTRVAIIGVTYLIDAFEGVGRIVKAVGLSIGATLAIAVQNVTGIASAMSLFIQGEYSQSWAAIKSTANATYQVGKDFMGDLSETFGAQSFGSKIRERMDEIKGVAAAAKEAKTVLDYDGNVDRDAAAKKEADAYATLISGLRTKRDELQLQLELGDQVTESQKEQIKLDKELEAGKRKLTPAHLDEVRATLAQIAAAEKALKLDAAQREVTKYIAESTAARDKDSASLAVQYQMYGKSADAREIAMVAVQSEIWKETELAKLRADKKPITDQIITQLNAEAKARTLVGEATLGQGKALQYAAQLHEENKRFGLDYITDEKARAAAILAIDDQMWQDRITLAGEGTEAQKILQDEYTAWYKNQSIKPQLDEQKKMWESVERTAHDTFVSIFDSGKSAFNRLRDTLKNGLLDLLYQMTLKKWIFDVSAVVSGGGMATAAQAATGSSGLAGVAGSPMGSILGSLGSIAAPISAFGSTIATGFMNTLAGTGMSAGLNAAGAMIANGAWAQGLGMAAGALGPIALGIGAVVMLAKALDHSGTYHTGGASSASSAGVSTIRAEDLHFEATRTSADTEKMTATLASGIVGILDSTALAFGKTAGYTAATAFADDTSKDGAWGGLVISKLGQTLVDWQDSRSSRWAPKEFADGAEGQKQYLSAISADVRTALNGIGLPAWAQKMLDGLGAAPAIEDMAKVVDAINATQKSLKAMGDQLVGFSSLSESAVSALIAASGGIQNLAAGASAYYDSFYSDAEKNAGALKQVSDAITGVGLAVPATRDEFRTLVESQMALGESGAPAVAVLFKVAGAFAQLHPLIEKTTTAIINQAQAYRDAAPGLLSNVDSAFSVLQSVAVREKGVIQGQIDAVNTRIAKEQALANALHSTLDAMRGSEKSVADFAAARAQIQAATAIRKAGGPLPDADALKAALSTVSQLTTESYATQTDYLRDLYGAQGDVEKLAKLTDSTLSIDEKSLAALQSQLQAIDSMVSSQQQAVDELKGINTNGLTLVNAIEGLRLAIESAKANPVVSAAGAVNDAYNTALGRAPDDIGKKFWQDRAAEGVPIANIVNAITTSPEAQVKGLYQSVLGRPADAGGLDFFLHSGASIDQIRNAMMASDEYTKKLRGFAVGANYIPADMPAMVHQGERIIPAADNRQLMARLSSPSGNSDALAAAVDRLTATVARQEAALAEQGAALNRIATNTKRGSDILEVVTEGGNGMRTVPA